jgi:hypothetical protein
MSWQPIETAPKDGTPILTYYADAYGMRRYSIRYWANDGAWRIDGERVTEGWSDEHRQLRGGSPSHWMPLPDPPHMALKPCPKCGKKQPIGDRCVECGLEFDQP